jgi:hypothetical protein
MKNLTVKVQQNLDKVTYSILKKRTLIFEKSFTLVDGEQFDVDLFHFFGIVRAVKYLADNRLDYTISSTSYKAIFWVIVKKVDLVIEDHFKQMVVDAAITYLKTIKTPHLLKI